VVQKASNLAIFLVLSASYVLIVYASDTGVDMYEREALLHYFYMLMILLVFSLLLILKGEKE
jgi:hypothetical protein